jgi:hypothetical protein
MVTEFNTGNENSFKPIVVRLPGQRQIFRACER